ncbi:Crp/Fnr family transcriptional regulator, partial [Salmonella enterica]|nr:Crp/Fnr family transcriptional regulator [Salmonella enterica]
ENSYAIKERYTVVKYMQTFSRLSRSMILKILAQLKIGGFIEMENGKLIRINKKLPEKF